MAFQVVCKDRRDDSPSGDGNEHYEQFLRQLQKTIDVVLEILDGSSVIVTGKLAPFYCAYFGFDLQAPMLRGYVKDRGLNSLPYNFEFTQMWVTLQP